MGNHREGTLEEMAEKVDVEKVSKCPCPDCNEPTGHPATIKTAEAEKAS